MSAPVGHSGLPVHAVERRFSCRNDLDHICCSVFSSSAKILNVITTLAGSTLLPHAVAMVHDFTFNRRKGDSRLLTGCLNISKHKVSLKIQFRPKVSSFDESNHANYTKDLVSETLNGVLCLVFNKGAKCLSDTIRSRRN